MNYIFGVIAIVIGLFLTISAFIKSKFILYRILTAYSKSLWKDNVHLFYKIVGILLVVIGFLFIFEVL